MLVERKEYLNKLIAFRDKQIIKVVTGIRRCGKSTLLEMYQDYLRKQGILPEQIISINFEDYDYEELTDGAKLYAYIKERLAKDKTTYIFLDEVHHVNDFPRVVDSLYIKKGIDLYITGSNAYMLSSEIATLISGRYVRIEMLPLSFKEYVKLDKVYDGMSVSVSPDDVITTGSSGEISITYDEERVTPFGTVYWARLDEAPAGAGSYRVNVVLKEDQWHSTVSLRTEFTISKADIQLEIRTDNMDKVYDGKEVENPPTYQAGGSNVRRLSWYEKNADGDWVLLGYRPVNAGIYKVVAAAEGDDNYNSAETELIFEITKAIPSYTLPEDLTAVQGQALSSVKLPEGFVWVDGAQKAESLGSQVFQANFVPADSRNYQTIEVGIPVRVIPASAAQNHKPEITAEDVTLTVGDSFDALANATASDAEDGDLTDRIEVLSSQVDTSRAGTYQVVYSVTDSQGETVTKTVTVTVKEKAVSQGQNQNSNPAANQTKTENQKTQVQAVQTGDHTNVYVWSAVLIISMAGAAVCILYKRKTYQ